MEERFVHDPNIGKFRIEAVVQKIAERLEKKLEKEGRTEEANQIFAKMLDVRALEKMTEKQDRNWVGPKRYLPIQHVINEASATTPLRL